MSLDQYKPIIKKVGPITPELQKKMKKITNNEFSKKKTTKKKK